MGSSYGKYGGEEKYIQAFWWTDMKERDDLEDTKVDERIILK